MSELSTLVTQQTQSVTGTGTQYVAFSFPAGSRRLLLRGVFIEETSASGAQALMSVYSGGSSGSGGTKVFGFLVGPGTLTTNGVLPLPPDGLLITKPASGNVEVRYAGNGNSRTIWAVAEFF